MAKLQGSWRDVKEKLAGFDRAGLLALVQDLYGASKENQAFLHSRFGVGGDVLKPYKEAIKRWLWPNVLGRHAEASVAKAKQAVSQYKNAVGDGAGLAELMVYFCEQGVGFSADVGYEDESYLNALVRMFAEALVLVDTLPAGERNAFVARLERVRDLGDRIGYGASDSLDDLFAQFVDDGE